MLLLILLAFGPLMLRDWLCFLCSYYMDTSAKEDIARDMKEHMCYVVNDFETRVRVEEAEQTEKTYACPRECVPAFLRACVPAPCRAVPSGSLFVTWWRWLGRYTLPDGTTYTLGSECFRLPEV